MSRHRNQAAQQERDRLRGLQAQERAARAAVREAARIERERERQRKANMIAVGEAEAAELNQELDARFDALESILKTALIRNPAIDFESLKDRTPPPPFAAPSDLAYGGQPPEVEEYMPPPLSFFGSLFGKQRHQRVCEEGQRKYEAARLAYEEAEQKRLKKLEQLRANHEHLSQKFLREQAAQQHGVDEFARRYHDGDAEAVASYCELVLTASPYPDGFPSEFRLAYVPDSKQVVIEYRLPTFDVVPEEKEFRYVKAKHEITWTELRIGDRKAVYTSLVGEVALRTLHELFSADVGHHLDVVVFNGYVNTVDPATGKDVCPYLITVRSTREEMQGLDLSRIEPTACLKHLKAQVSRSPSELLPVRPIVDFNMVDPRFIEHGDVLGELDQRPNLMELSPGEFETLVTNLFERMGLETRLTQASRDGGVDCVAYDQRPILGGKVVIQAKRYQHTVGVSAVRDLFGTMHNEGANKGILVTTSDYGKAAFEFANGKPIELINGSNLLYLLAQQGIEAKIEIPEGWQDPVEPY